jgi:hypothetical protein
MRKENVRTVNRRRGNRGAAILIAVAAAMIVMLAVGILFFILDRMVSDQLRREEEVQMGLTEEGALDALMLEVSLGGPLEQGAARTFQMGGVTTVLTVGGSEPAPPRTAGFPVGGDSAPVLIPSGESVFAATPDDGNTVTVFSGVSGERIGSFRLGIDRDLTGTCPAQWQGADAAVLVFGSGESCSVLVVTRDGVKRTLPAGLGQVGPGSVITFGGDPGEPLLAVSNGHNHGTVVNLVDGESGMLVSPPGTCPLVTPSGRVFGAPGVPSSFTLAPPVEDAFFGDFDRDGREDVGWAGPRSLVCLTASGLYRGSPSPEAFLGAWGSVEGSLGLGGRWILPGGATLWTRLNNEGFGEFTPAGALSLPWEGAFYGSMSGVVGVSEGRVILAAGSGGYTTALLEDGPYTWGDGDGADVDVFAASPGEFLAVFNPLSGDGLAQTVDSRSTGARIVRSGAYTLLIFDGPGDWRVFSQRERPGR